MMTRVPSLPAGRRMWCVESRPDMSCRNVLRQPMGPLPMIQGVTFVDTTAVPTSPAVSGGISDASADPGVTGDTAFKGAGGSAEASFRTNGS